MHIGFDISQTGRGRAGCGFFAHAMIQSLLALGPQHNYALYPGFGNFYFDVNMPQKSPYPGCGVSYGPLHQSVDEASAFWLGGDLEATLGMPDIIHANNFWCPTQLQSSRLVYTLYDLSFVQDSSWTTELNRAACFDGVFRASVAADWVVAISEDSRDHFLRVFPHFPPQRVRVVYPCSRFTDPQAMGVQSGSLSQLTPGAYWLSVGTLEPRKNQRRLAQAYAQYLSQGGPPIPLVFAGGNGWMMHDFNQHLAALGITSQVVVTGYVSDDELIWLYRNCFANLYPSLFEGFGLPVLEGMQFGAATLASNVASIAEVAGDAALLLPAEDADGWAQAMLRVAASSLERDRLKAASTLRAMRFDWQQSAAAVLQVYEEALSAPKRCPVG